jgi:hypothetical protein
MTRREEPADRFARLMPSGDLTLIVLKGHLLIEELLFTLVERGMESPVNLRDARLRFPQLVHLARAMHGGEDLNKVSRVLLAVNSLRNDLAHRLESKDIDGRIAGLEKTFTDACETELSGQSVEQRLTSILEFLWLFLFLRPDDRLALSTTRVSYEVSHGILRDADLDDYVQGD